MEELTPQPHPVPATTKIRFLGSPLVTSTSSYDKKDSSLVLGSELEHEPTVSSQAGNAISLSASDGEDEPVFHRHQESTTIELFYDLFFVANLTTFSNLHEITNNDTLTSYIGFFCVLWSTWCLTSLHDIRFVSDSLVGRMAKGVHLGVMVGLAVSGPKYAIPGHRAELSVLAMILMVSRLMLGLQYLLVLWHVRDYKKSKSPLAIIAGFSLVAAMVYLGVSFASTETDRAYSGFYIVAVTEMAINIIISSQWRVVTFKGTNLIERMSLLTLYILGEGVIDILKSVTKISQAQDYWSSANIGTLLAAILAIYLFYMLYFDALNRTGPGSMRHQIWSFCHFPFHATMVLCVSGMAQFVIWQKIAEAYSAFVADVVAGLEEWGDNTPDNTSNEDAAKSFVAQISQAVNRTFSAYPPDNLPEVNERMHGLFENIEGNFTAELDANNTALNLTWATLDDMEFDVLNTLMTTFGFSGEEMEGESATESLESRFNTATLFFGYFFVSTGLALIILGILRLVNSARRTIRSWVRFGTHFAFGTALCLFALLLTGDHERADNLGQTAWPLPIVALVLLIVLAIHHLSVRGGKPEEDGEKKLFLKSWGRSRQNTVMRGDATILVT